MACYLLGALGLPSLDFPHPTEEELANWHDVVSLPTEPSQK